MSLCECGCGQVTAIMKRNDTGLGRVKGQHYRFLPHHHERVRKSKPMEDRFWPKVNKNGPIPDYQPDLGPCWIWLAGQDGMGYGSFGIGAASSDKAYRVAYRLIKGAIPKGLTLDHLCRVRICVNPDHLEAVTLAENKRRGFSPAAINARRDHTKCLRGHPYLHPTDRKNGCTTCRVEWGRRKRNAQAR